LIFRKIKNNPELFYLIIIASLGVMAGSVLAPVEALYISSLTENKILLGLTFAVGTAFLTLASILICRYSRKISPRRLALPWRFCSL
jgi:hypothetical protein